jgi:hypothetical protein
VFLAIVALVGVTAVTVRIVSASAAGCSGGIPVRVVATPEIAPILEELGAAWMATEPQVGGECVQLTVSSMPSATVASSLTVYAGRAIDTAAAPEPTPAEDTLPTVWIPDSTAWVNRVQVVDRASFVEDLRSIATSPVVVAMPEQDARGAGWPAPLPVTSVRTLLGQGALKLGVAEPRRETASLAATMLLGDALATSDEDLPALVQTFRGVVKKSSTADLLAVIGTEANAGPASEQAILAHNEAGASVPLVAVRLEPFGAQLDYPYAIRSGTSRETEQAAQLFRAELLGEDAGEGLAEKGFRTPDGTAGPGFPSAATTEVTPFAGVPVDDIAAVQRALGLWSAANSPSRTLALFDVTASMDTAMATATGGGTRASVMVAAAQGGLGLFTADSRVGMWAFGAQHQEVLSIDDLTPERKADFAQRMAGARPTASNRSELYATLLAAYQLMLEGYDASRPNIIVVLTDGGDSDTSELRLEQFNQDLQKLADPTRPVRVVLIGISVGAADAANLQTIAGIVGGGFFPLTSPEQIQTIFLKALLRVGAA